MSWIDILIVAVYLASVTAMGFFFYKRASTSSGFATAEGKMKGWVVGFSIFGTYLSSISFIALPGASFAEGWNRFAFSLSLPLAAWVATRWFTRYYRRTGHVSAYASLETRFGVWARLYAMTFYLLTQFARVGTITFLVALTLNSAAGWDIRMVIVVVGTLVTVYTVMGGIEAVIWTDMVQSIVLITGAVVCATILLFSMPEGPGQVFRIGMDSGKFSMGPYGLSLFHTTFWVTLVYGVFINLQNFGIDQNYVQRYLASESQKEADRSVWFGALLYIPVSALFFFIGTELFAYYSVFPGLLPEHLAAPGAGDKVFPHFMMTQLPTGFKGLLIAALLAAAMSTVSSSLNSSSTILMSDLYTRFLFPDADDRHKTLFLRFSSLALGFFGVIAALLMINNKSALDQWWKLSGVFSGGMLGLFLLGIMTTRARSAHAAVGVAAGLSVIVWASFGGTWGLPENPLHPFMTIVMGTCAIFLVGMAAAMALGKPQSRG